MLGDVNIHLISRRITLSTESKSNLSLAKQKQRIEENKDREKHCRPVWHQDVKSSVKSYSRSSFLPSAFASVMAAAPWNFSSAWF
ncbi:UNVERIFIED_CONTAM: hypothetical protein Sangu_2849600 [Sesamum angustifolium]|uniref:Uncharacterized protein n=1 Tax=Sesamum angustifolium TaxID=2727405 RepID=A0AAW2IPZ7_9LAMI